MQALRLKEAKVLQKQHLILLYFSNGEKRTLSYQRLQHERKGARSAFTETHSSDIQIVSMDPLTDGIRFYFNDAKAPIDMSFEDLYQLSVKK